MLIRNERLDILKGFLMCLVIWGHVIGSHPEGLTNVFFRTFIYSFHMPLFVFVSGFFSQIKDASKLKKSIKKLIFIYISFQVISIALLFIYNKPINYGFIVVPYWTLWYLLSLIFWRGVLFILVNKCVIRYPIHLIIISLLLSLFIGLIPYGRILSIQRTFFFFPYFLYGYYLHNGLMKFKWDKRYSLISIFLFIVIFMKLSDGSLTLVRYFQGANHIVLRDIPYSIFTISTQIIISASVLYLFMPQLSNLFTGKSPSSIQNNQLHQNSVTLETSVKIPITLSKVQKYYNCISSILSNIGRHSLFYYVYHSLLIAFCLNPIISILNLPQNAYANIVYSMIITGILYYMNLFPILKFWKFIKQYSNNL